MFLILLCGMAVFQPGHEPTRPSPDNCQRLQGVLHWLHGPESGAMTFKSHINASVPEADGSIIHSEGGVEPNGRCAMAGATRQARSYSFEPGWKLIHR